MLHYALLCAFCWMLVEGLNIYRSLTAAFEHRANAASIHALAAFAYTVPAIVVLVTASNWMDAYGTDQVCWLSYTQSRAIYAFAGPAAVIGLVNLVLFVRTLVAVTQMPIKRNSGDTAKYVRAKRSLMASASFFSVMGLGWTFGLAALENGSLPLVYLFAVLGSLQGLLIMIFNVWRDPIIHHWYRSAVTRSEPSSTPKPHAPAMVPRQTLVPTTAASGLATKESTDATSQSDARIAAVAWCMWLVNLCGVVMMSLGYADVHAASKAVLQGSLYQDESTAYQTLLHSAQPCLIAGVLVSTITSTVCVISITFRSKQLYQTALRFTLPMLNLVSIALVVVVWYIGSRLVHTDAAGRMSCELMGTALSAMCNSSQMTESDRRSCQYALPENCCYLCDTKVSGAYFLAYLLVIGY